MRSYQLVFTNINVSNSDKSYKIKENFNLKLICCHISKIPIYRSMNSQYFAICQKKIK